MSDRETRQNRQDESYPDFDAISITIAIKDEIETNEEYHYTGQIGELELEAAPDSVETQARLALDEMLHEYQSHRDEDDE